MRTETVSCYLCHSDESKPWATESGFQMVKCRKCGLVYLNPRPDLNEIDEAARIGLHRFGQGALNAIGAYSSKKVQDYQCKIEAALAPDKIAGKSIRWLDIGAGFGELVKAVKDLAAPDSVIEGIEPCEPKVVKAMAKGLPVTTTPLSQVEGPYTHVSLINVYSHLPNPVEFLGDLDRIMNPGSHLIMVTGNGGEIERREFPGSLYLPDHLSFAGESNIRSALSDAGFEIQSIIF